MRTYDAKEIEISERQQEARDLDRALTGNPQGLADFFPRAGFGSDPSQLGWPPTLVVELALKVDTPRSICESYGISREEWDLIRVNPVFIADLGRAVEAMKKEGASFKARAQLQSMELLKESWRIIHDQATPANVRADLIKFTIKAAGLDASREAANGPQVGVGFSITLNLG